MMRDLRWAMRWLRRNPLFAIAVVAILGLGTGASTAAFSITDAVLLRPAADRAGRSLVRVEEKSTKRSMFGMPATDYLRWRDRSDLFETSAPFVKDMVTLGGIDTPDQMFALRTAGRLFTMLNSRDSSNAAMLVTPGGRKQDYYREVSIGPERRRERRWGRMLRHARFPLVMPLGAIRTFRYTVILQA